MLTLEEVIDNDSQRMEVWLEKMDKSTGNEKKFSSNLREYNRRIAVLAIRNSDLKTVKDHLNIAGLIDIWKVQKHNDRLLDYALSNITDVLLSDNEETIATYAKLTYEADGQLPNFETNVLNGGTGIWVCTVQSLVSNNTKVIERNFDILQSKVISKLPAVQEDLQLDFRFYKALYEGKKMRQN